MQSPQSNNFKKYNTTRVDKAKWAQIISEWQKSNESQIQFCKRLNLKLNTFVYAKNKLLKNALPKKFIPVSIKENVMASQILSQYIILENPLGLKIHIPSTMLEEKWLQLLKLAGW